MTRKSFCFSLDEKSSYSNEERLQLAELVKQFKKEHLKENENLGKRGVGVGGGGTRYDKKRKKHVPVVTHGNFVAKAVRKFIPIFRINQMMMHNFVQPTVLPLAASPISTNFAILQFVNQKKHESLAKEESQRPLKFGKGSLFGLLIFEKH